MLRSGLIAPEKEARALDTIERNATSLTEIIEDVLDVSRIISGKIRLNVRPVDLQTVIRESIEAVRPRPMREDIRIECILDSTEAPVSGDPERCSRFSGTWCRTPSSSLSVAGGCRSASSMPNRTSS